MITGYVNNKRKIVFANREFITRLLENHLETIIKSVKGFNKKLDFINDKIDDRGKKLVSIDFNYGGYASLLNTLNDGIWELQMNGEDISKEKLSSILNGTTSNEDSKDIIGQQFMKFIKREHERLIDQIIDILEMLTQIV